MKRSSPVITPYRNTSLNRDSVFALLFSFREFELIGFEVAVPNVYLVPAAQDHDPFHRSKNQTVRQMFFSKKKISYHLNNVSVISNISKNDLSAKTNLTAMRCSVTSHFSVNCRDKMSTCEFDFQLKIVIALLIEFIFYSNNVYYPLNIYYKEICISYAFYVVGVH